MAAQVVASRVVLSSTELDYELEIMACNCISSGMLAIMVRDNEKRRIVFPSLPFHTPTQLLPPI
jgi:hypothetical protein